MSLLMEKLPVRSDRAAAPMPNRALMPSPPGVWLVPSWVTVRVLPDPVVGVKASWPLASRAKAP